MDKGSNTENRPTGGIEDLADQLGKDEKKKNSHGRKIEGQKKPPRKAENEKLGDDAKSKAIGMAATVVIAACLGIFVLTQMFSGTGTGGTGDTGPAADPGTQQTQPQAQGSQGPEVVIDGNQQQEAHESSDNLFDRTPWAYKLEDEDGNAAAGTQGGTVESGTRYWVCDPSGDRLYKIIIPAGYNASDLGDCIMISKGDMSVTGDDPLEFYWKYSTEIKLLFERGGCDMLAMSGSAGFDQYDVKAEGYYLFKDENGDEYPVVTALLSRVSSSEADEAYYEYWIVVGKETNAHKYLAGSVTLTGFQAMKSGVAPDITAMAKSFFPASSEPGFPEYWDYGTEQAPAAESTDGADNTGGSQQGQGPGVQARPQENQESQESQPQQPAGQDPGVQANGGNGN